MMRINASVPIGITIMAGKSLSVLLGGLESSRRYSAMVEGVYCGSLRNSKRIGLVPVVRREVDDVHRGGVM
jgi:hypothetical protein